ncbi:MAG TPA: nicotinate (nicotinamide) nucleotide adenylyltransferase [Vicinamibacterales bacterium]
MKLGVLGGTFDPIHNGHIAAAQAAQDQLGLDAIMLMPSRIPPHRQDPVGATSEQRFEMAQLAAAEHQGWSASRIEVDREGPSYTFDTLTELRGLALTLRQAQGHPERSRGMSERGASRSDGPSESKGTQIFFIIGTDAFAEIATWSRYPAVLGLANFVVVSRTGITLNSLRERVPSAFRHHPPCTPSDLRVLDSETPRVILVEANTPDISSTDIRRRVRAGDPFDDLVPEAVARYITAHRLYAGPPMAQN